MTRSAADIRNEFLEFFRQRGHEIVPSSPVVPHNDPTLLFTNAGMNQFKEVFLGTGKLKFSRAADTQKCIRAGGKHNDLDDVGHDTYHHTFFEMLGNWSFGDYFKKEAIQWAWELLTDVWGLEKDRLHATYFEGDEPDGLEPDLEAKELWASVTDIDPSHIHPGGKKDNFWEMGQTGPCGPCSEIHIDLTPDKSGGPLVNAGDARVIELWNLVFIQFSRSADGKLTPLPAKHVDTGLGFERVTALLQGKTSNYDTDIFTPIFEAIREVTGAPPYTGTLPEEKDSRVQGSEDSGIQGAKDSRIQGSEDSSGSAGPAPSNPRTLASSNPQTMIDVSYRVIADHIRCLTFALTDGAVPDREGRGYVLRSILRRAVFYGRQYLNMHEPFLCRLVPAVADVMASAFRELRAARGGKNVEYVAELIREEEESFGRTLDRGILSFNSAAAKSVGRAIARERQWEFVAISTAVWQDEEPRHWTLRFAPPDSGPTIRMRNLEYDTIRQVTSIVPVISGEDAFKLHDTYGFPIGLTEIMAEEKGLHVDIGEYDRLMDEARERARSVKDATTESWYNAVVNRCNPTTFVGYTQLRVPDALLEFVCTIDGVMRASGLDTGERGVLVLQKSPFYGEAGGQVGDTGVISGVIDGGPWEFEVETTKRIYQTNVHIGKCLRGPIMPSRRGGGSGPRGEFRQLPKLQSSRRVTANAAVDAAMRQRTMQNHTATHVMNWALREVLGENVQQKGSLVDPDKTRFDFSHPRALTDDQLERVEHLSNQQIERNLTVYDKQVPQAEALKINGLRAVFGEKYPDVVRVVSVGVPVEKLLEQPDNADWRGYSIEFCGGTHLSDTSQIEHFVLTAEESVAKGIRRLVAITGQTAALVEEIGASAVKRADEILSGPPQAASEGLTELQGLASTTTLTIRHRRRFREAIGELQRVVKKQRKADAADAAGVVGERVKSLIAEAPRIGDTTVVIGEMPDVGIEQLKHGADIVKAKCGSAAILFGVRVGGTEGRSDEATKRRSDQAPERRSDEATKGSTGSQPAGKALLLAAMSDDLIKRGLKAGDLVKHVAPIIKGGGGGPPTMAQAGGKEPGKLDEALDSGRVWISERLS